VFFQVPNQSRIRRTLFSRACGISVSSQEKSKRPSTGSICSHATGISSVLAWSARIVGQTSGSMAG